MFSPNHPCPGLQASSGALNRDVALQDSSSSCLSSFPGISSGAESSGMGLLLPAPDVCMRKKIKSSRSGLARTSLRAPHGSVQAAGACCSLCVLTLVLQRCQEESASLCRGSHPSEVPVWQQQQQQQESHILSASNKGESLHTIETSLHTARAAASRRLDEATGRI